MGKFMLDTLESEADSSIFGKFFTKSQLKKLEKQNKKQNKNNVSNVTPIQHNQRNSFKKLHPKNDKQKQLLSQIDTLDQIIAVGSAGTGKTYCVAYKAAEYYNAGKVNKIVITRPNIATGKSIGFFPGTIEEKMAPWVAPIISVLKEFLGHNVVDLMMKRKQIEIVPFEVIRGYSFQDAFVILDEAQNADIASIKSMLTRIGEGSKFVMMGDTTQKDLKDSESGLSFALNIISKSKSLQEMTGITTFTSDEIVRSGLVKAWVQAFERY